MAHLEQIVVGGTLAEVEKLDHSAQQVDDAIDRVSGKNLFLDWDFRRPVNRNGQGEYTAAGYPIYTIDRWLTSAAWKVKIENGQGILTNLIYQKVENESALDGKTLTFSVLTADNRLLTGTSNFVYNTTAPIIFFGDTQSELLAYNESLKGFEFYSASGGVPLLAAKLELGSTQTLARQNEDGEWEIIDPPDYDLQYLLCSQYSPSTGEWVGSQHSNPDLLDNAYWANKASIINQRGQTEYLGVGYTIDRWGTASNVTAVVMDDCIRLTYTGYGDYGQHVEQCQALAGQTVTLSVLCRGTGAVRLYMYDSAMAVPIDGGWAALPFGAGLTVVSVTGIVPQKAYRDGQLCFMIGSQGCTFDALAAKLELGPIQTLAHKEGDTWVLNDPPPNKALELLECQRYFEWSPWACGTVVCRNATDMGVTFPIWFKATKRAQPAVVVNSAPLQSPVVIDMTANTVVNATVAQPVAWNSDMLSVRILGSFAIGHIYHITVGDRQYGISADL